MRPASSVSDDEPPSMPTRRSPPRLGVSAPPPPPDDEGEDEPPPQAAISGAAASAALVPSAPRTTSRRVYPWLVESGVSPDMGALLSVRALVVSRREWRTRRGRRGYQPPRSRRRP